MSTDSISQGIDSALAGLRSQVNELQSVVKQINAARSLTATPAAANRESTPVDSASSAMEVDAPTKAETAVTKEGDTSDVPPAVAAVAAAEAVPMPSSTSETQALVAQLQAQVAGLQTENAKLKYRLGHLCRAYDAKVDQLAKLAPTE
ncbi:hypothetical protein IWQ60_003931 [Tieghemiomyces parasiticus]|uniref:Uncharacterized protein n=1 Tax=Tieghemiomyces parasiticus TaxID=78921 RepID=A0A9W8DVZ7_9FUNG|nr:hypothetical protein IWQ60_003931 [Tieghemiomyces parasiticus]